MSQKIKVQDGIVVYESADTDSLNFSIKGILSLNPQSLPTEPTNGMLAICDGTTWNPEADGLQHLMVYMNNTWTTIV